MPTMSRYRRQESARRLEREIPGDILAVAAELAPLFRWKTGLAKDEPDIWVRREKDRRPLFYYGDIKGAWVPMGIYEDEEGGNEAALADLTKRRVADRMELLGKEDISRALLVRIEAEYIGLQDPGPKGTPDEFKQLEKQKTCLRRIVQWMGRKSTVAHAIPAKFRQYEVWRTAQLARPGTKSKKLVAPSTAAADVRWLSAAINSYAAERNQVVAVSVADLPRAERREFFLTGELYVRLLVTLRRGWLWDAKKGGWKTETVVDPLTGAESERKVVDPAFAREGERARFRGRMMQRALTVAHYTGARSGMLVDLGWTYDPVRGWIDVDNGRVNQSGTKPRKKRRKSGKRLRETKRQPVVPMAFQFRAMARIWREADARVGATHVIQRWGGDGCGYAGSSVLRLIQDGGERIGIARSEFCLHSLRHSCVTQLLLGNCSPAFVADFVGDTIETVLYWYAHLGLDKPYIGPSRAAIPKRDPVEVLEMRDRGPMLAKRERLAKEKKERAQEARRRRAELRVVD